MVIISKSIKLFRNSLLVFCIFFNIIFIFATYTLAHETYGDAMKWYNGYKPTVDSKQNYLIGLKLENDGQNQKALSFFKKSADSGLIEAQLKVGLYFLKSDNLFEQKEARKIFKSLSDIKIPIASFKLGWMYENAIGGEKNVYKASYFYKLAASRDQYNAYLYLANLSLTDPNDINILLAASYSSIAKKKNVTGSNSLLNRLLPLLETHELDEIAILISSLESEIEKIKLINS
tara:strand:- start:9 stop:707 length:699 start_codon:yes stop_codon:yes gene_type:complete